MKRINFFIEGVEVSLYSNYAIVNGIRYCFLRDKFNCLEIPISQKESIIIQPKCHSSKVKSGSSYPDMIELIYYGVNGNVEFAEIILQKGEGD